MAYDVNVMTHKVKHAYRLPKKNHTLFVVECVCGWSSALMDSTARANDAYMEHKRKAALALESTEGTEA